jgi:hypothetical protein
MLVAGIMFSGTMDMFKEGRRTEEVVFLVLFVIFTMIGYFVSQPIVDHQVGSIPNKG